MATRLSSSSRTPISERIKLFDAGGSTKSRVAPLGSSKPGKPAAAAAAPQQTTPAAPQPSPVLKPLNSSKSQFSTKDPTNLKTSTPAQSTKKSPTNSVASSKSDLSRTPSNASTKSADKTSPSSSALAKSRTAASSAVNGRNSPATPIKKSAGPSHLSPVKKTVSRSASNKSTSSGGGQASPNTSSTKSSPNSSAHTPSPANGHPTVLSKKDEAPAKTPTPSKSSTPRSTTIEGISPIAAENSTVVPPTEMSPTPSESSPEPPVTPVSVDADPPSFVISSRKTSLISESSSVKNFGPKTDFDNFDAVDKAVFNNNKENALNYEKTEVLEKNVINKKSSVKGLAVYEEKNYWSKQALNNHTAETISQAMKLDVESKDEKISSLQKEITEMQMGGANEDEVRSLKKSKKDLEMQIKEQEEELDDFAAQVQMLEASKTKLEMEMATLKKEHRREMTNKDEEIEEARASANKKVKILEQQLEQEHEERIMFLRERHDLEQKIGTLQDMLERSGDEEQVAKLKRDLKKTKALLRDAQTLVEKTQNEGTNKVILRQLKNQLEDAEFARTAAMKARQNAELELADTQTQLEDVSRSKQDLEDRHLRLSREKAELSSQLQENEEELQEVMRKYKASVAAVSTDQITIQDQQNTIQELENERNKLRDQVAELSSKLGNLEGENVSTSQHKRLELKVRELESKMELEVTAKNRLETQIQRLKESIEKLTKEKDDLRLKEQGSQEQHKKTSRQLRDLKEDYATLQGKETELGQKKFDLEKQLEVAEAETLTVRSDLKLAMKRIEDLQAALAGELDSDNSDDNSDSSDEEMQSFLEHHRRAMSVQRERESMARESVFRDSLLRESVGRDSVHRESVSREVRASSGRTFSAIDETKETISLDTSKPIEEGDESLA